MRWTAALLWRTSAGLSRDPFRPSGLGPATVSDFAQAQEDRPEGVRTRREVSSPCPMCQGPLKGRQTVCSPRCRAKRWRNDSRRRAQGREMRDEEIRALLAAALRKLEEASR